MGDDVEVLAAGGVVWRPAGAEPEILLIHRPRYDDWTLPKGKLDPGETEEAAAVREVLEETGFHVEVGDLVARSRYHDQHGRSKEVAYYDLRVTVGEFAPNDEVDEARWAVPAVARLALSYERDVEVLEAFLLRQR
jgi:8-oxo-dGTP diphosphatase